VAAPSDHSRAPNRKDTDAAVDSVEVVDEKLSPSSANEAPTEREQPTRDSEPSTSLPGEPPLLSAVLAIVFVPPTRVTLRAPPRVPERDTEDDKDALCGRISTAPDKTEMLDSCDVSSSREAYAQSWGSRGRLEVAALVNDATNTPEALTFSKLVTPELGPAHP
jgi:hypothetical protein